uniref:RING-type domain-containing protein n=1 Tax=Cairina moschata TaxID=8855 RepID=A0A8C3GJW7_CAIMO
MGSRKYYVMLPYLTLDCSCSTLLYDGSTCPICLNGLLEQEIGVPESCSHTFCMTCILKWAEVRQNQGVFFFY